MSYASILTKKSNTLDPKLWSSLPDDIKSMIGIYLPSNLFITLNYLLGAVRNYINDGQIKYLYHKYFLNRWYKSSKDLKIDIFKVLMDPISDYSIWNIAFNSSIRLTAANVCSHYSYIHGNANFMDGSYFNWIKKREKQFRDKLLKETPWHKYCKISRDISILRLQEVNISVYNNEKELLYDVCMYVSLYSNDMIKEIYLGEKIIYNILENLIKKKKKGVHYV